MEYYIFIQDDAGMEKLVASSPSLEIARKTAQRMANSDIQERTIVSALICRQKEEGGEVLDLELYKRGQEKGEVL